MPRNLTNYFDGAPKEGKRAEDTDLLKPGAREPASTVTATNKLTAHRPTHKPFGKLGNRGSGK